MYLVYTIYIPPMLAFCNYLLCLIFRKKTELQKSLHKEPEEKILFHGTKEDLVDVICKDGFDWRVAGTSNGTLYGKGSYFARDSSYSKG